MRDLLAKIRDIADPALPVDQAGHRMPLALGCCDDWSSIMVGDVVESERNMLARQNVPDRNAEGGLCRLYKRKDKKLQGRGGCNNEPVIKICHPIGAVLYF